jgi:hypothetical protein
VTRTEEQRAIEEALDRLLDPLAEDERPPPLPMPMPEILPLDAVRRDRVVFRITRRLAGWAVGLAAFWAAIWIIVR